jgi:hypothetical protein
MGKDLLTTGFLTPENGTKEIKSEFLKSRFGQEQKDNKDSDSDTATTSSDKFDWSEEEPSEPKPPLRATRGRWLWMTWMKLAKTIRVLLISIFGTAFFVTPLVVVNLRFREQPARLQVHIWSLWLTIIWAASCGTYLIVDLIPRFVVGITRLFGGRIERLKIQVEVCHSKPYPNTAATHARYDRIAYNGR